MSRQASRGTSRRGSRSFSKEALYEETVTIEVHVRSFLALATARCPTDGHAEAEVTAYISMETFGQHTTGASSPSSVGLSQLSPTRHVALFVVCFQDERTTPNSRRFPLRHATACRWGNHTTIWAYGLVTIRRQALRNILSKVDKTVNENVKKPSSCPPSPF